VCVSLLSGVTVIEVASVITGPYAGMLLADLGADVIKVESPDGDQFRRWQAESEEIRSAFAAYNRGKRSVVLDLKTEEGRQALERLVTGADVVIENFRPGVMDRLGVGWARLREVNPRLVYCYVSGMGSMGPERSRPTYDAVAQALSGLWSQLTDVSDPQPVGPPMADQLTGMFSAIAILAGLQHRVTTGEGTQVEVSMLAACLGFQTSAISAYCREGEVADMTSRAHNSQSYAFVASDGLPFAIHLSTPRKFWQGLCHTVERADLIDDERYATKSARIRAYDELHRIFGEVFRTAPRAHWLDALARHDVPAAPINRIDEALSHPQVEAIGIVDHGDDVPPGLRGLVRSPISTGGEQLSSRRPPPLLGADSVSVLTGAGYTEAEIEHLRSLGVLR
jgi:crotonobetainyl-CoA:carnitine CoA-transferase CaiB-like acyl-CoA transferase